MSESTEPNDDDTTREEDNDTTREEAQEVDNDDYWDALRQSAMRGNIDEAVTAIRDRRTTARSGGTPMDAVKVHVFTGYATEGRDPAEVAKLVTDLDADDTTSDLARLALDKAVAAPRSIPDLCQLIAGLTGNGCPGEPGRVLQSVIQQRTSFDIAELLSALPVDAQTELLGKLISDSTPNDCRVRVALWLRARGYGELAKKATQQFSRHLAQGLLADLVRGLFTQPDKISAVESIDTVLHLDNDNPYKDSDSLRRAATLASDLHAVSPALGDQVVDRALKVLEPSDKLVLASELRTGEWEDDAAARLWEAAAVGPQVDVGPLVDALDRFPGDVEKPLRKAAETHDIERVARLAIEVQGRIPGKEATVLETVAEKRGVSEIFAMARHLTDYGYGDMAWVLLTKAANRVHERRVHERRDGEAAGDFIDRLLDDEGVRSSAKLLKQLTTSVLENVASNRDPDQLMGMVARLMKKVLKQRQYYELHSDTEAAVAKHFTGDELIRLPLVKGSLYRPAVLEIEKKALAIPRKGITAQQFPGIVRALKEIGTLEDDLKALLLHIGEKNLNADLIHTNLVNQGMLPEAGYVASGISSGAKHPKKEPRFFPPPERPKDQSPS